MNTKTVILSLFLTVIMMTCLTAVAQGPGGQGHRPPAPAIDTAIDADGNEVISADEIAEAASALIGLDTDGDGVLSFAECMGFSPDGKGKQGPPPGRSESGGHPPAPPLFSALDSNGDQVIGSGESTNASTTLQTLDSNGDGELSGDEYRPQPPGGQRPGPSTGGGQSMR